MKEETKELIIWIKKQINLAKQNCIDVAWNGKHEYYNADYEKAMKFLDSLPQIESQLKVGGYIADVNNTPCCNGDKVKFSVTDKDIYFGTLMFNFTYKCFCIVCNNGNAYFFFNDGIKWFEKV